MNYQTVLIVIIIGFAMLSAFTLVVIGAFTDHPGYVTTGVGILTTGLGYVAGDSDVLSKVKTAIKKAKK
jgi:hypothetical protein